MPEIIKLPDLTPWEEEVLMEWDALYMAARDRWTPEVSDDIDVLDNLGQTTMDKFLLQCTYLRHVLGVED